MPIAIGVDPGIKGALALVCSERGVLEVADMPTTASGAGPKARVQRKADARGLARLVNDWSRKHDLAKENVSTVVERMQAFGGKGSSPLTLLSMGHTAGVVEGVLASGSDEFVQVGPRTWKALYGLDSDKAASLDVARKLFPEAAGLLARKKDNDRAEAILLAHWLLTTRFA